MDPGEKKKVRRKRGKEKWEKGGMRRQKKTEVSSEQRHIPMSHHFSGKLSFMYLYLLQQLTV